jgi:hypothetical protein
MSHLIELAKQVRGTTVQLLEEVQRNGFYPWSNVPAFSASQFTRFRDITECFTS